MSAIEKTAKSHPTVASKTMKDLPHYLRPQMLPHEADTLLHLVRYYFDSGSLYSGQCPMTVSLFMQFFRTMRVVVGSLRDPLSKKEEKEAQELHQFLFLPKGSEATELYPELAAAHPLRLLRELKQVEDPKAWTRTPSAKLALRIGYLPGALRWSRPGESSPKLSGLVRKNIHTAMPIVHLLLSSHRQADLLKDFLTRFPISPMIVGSLMLNSVNYALGTSSLSILASESPQTFQGAKHTYMHQCFNSPALPSGPRRDSYLDYLISRQGCDPRESYLSPSYARTPLLHTIVQAGDVAWIHKAIGQYGCDPHETDFEGNTALHVAAGSGRIDIFSILGKGYRLHCGALNEGGRRPFDMCSSKALQAQILEVEASLDFVGPLREKPGRCDGGHGCK